VDAEIFGANPRHLLGRWQKKDPNNICVPYVEVPRKVSTYRQAHKSFRQGPEAKIQVRIPFDSCRDGNRRVPGATRFRRDPGTHRTEVRARYGGGMGRDFEQNSVALFRRKAA